MAVAVAVAVAVDLGCRTDPVLGSTCFQVAVVVFGSAAGAQVASSRVVVLFLQLTKDCRTYLSIIP